MPLKEKRTPIKDRDKLAALSLLPHNVQITLHPGYPLDRLKSPAVEKRYLVVS